MFHLSTLPSVIVTPVVVALVALAGDHLALRDPRVLAIFVSSLVGAWLLIFFTMILLGSLAFFLESSLGVFEMWLALHSILSGYLSSKGERETPSSMPLEPSMR